MKARKRQRLFDLLAYASCRRASAEFCHNVTSRAQAVRQHSSSPALSFSAVAAALLVLGIGAAVLLLPSPPTMADRSAPRHANSLGQESCTEEFEKIVLMDELLAVNDPAQLDDEAFAKLLFR
jgi:hypothetical protein